MIIWRNGKAGYAGGDNYLSRSVVNIFHSLTSESLVTPPVFAGTIPDINGNVGDPDIVTDLSTYFTDATSYSITPAVEAGWNFDTVTGILTVDTDFGIFGPYVVFGTNGAGYANSNTFNVTMTFNETSSAVSTSRTKAFGGVGVKKAIGRGKITKLKGSGKNTGVKGGS